MRDLNRKVISLVQMQVGQLGFPKEEDDYEETGRRL